jgi:fermentation-respiration switch protein FrsA (DUF1100 family)
MMTLKWLVVAGLVGYGALTAFMYLAQRSLMYFPDTARTMPAEAGLPQAEELVLDAADGEKVIIWHVAPRGEKPVALYFHGNGGALRHRVFKFRQLIDDGTGLVALSYRGFGGSSGHPSEAGLLQDGTAAYQFARARYPAERLIAWGESLGTGVAVALAAEHPVGHVVLEAPFASAVDIAARVYPFLPVRILMKDQFRSDQRIGRVTAPVLVLHGVRDDVVPIDSGERLFALIKGAKKFVRYPDGVHDDLDRYGTFATVREFIAQP